MTCQTHTASLAWRDDEPGFRAWCEGRTGYPLVDAGMRQLVRTGWMHNRLRMVTAMFLSKHLLIDWRRGEAFFMRHLVDGEFAANNGGWQWRHAPPRECLDKLGYPEPIVDHRAARLRALDAFKALQATDAG